MPGGGFLHLSDQDRIVACAGAHIKSINVRLKLIQYKWTYVTPVDFNGI